MFEIAIAHQVRHNQHGLPWQKELCDLVVIHGSAGELDGDAFNAAVSTVAWLLLLDSDVISSGIPGLAAALAAAADMRLKDDPSGRTLLFTDADLQKLAKRTPGCDGVTVGARTRNALRPLLHSVIDSRLGTSRRLADDEIAEYVNRIIGVPSLAGLFGDKDTGGAARKLLVAANRFIIDAPRHASIFEVALAESQKDQVAKLRAVGGNVNGIPGAVILPSMNQWLNAARRYLDAMQFGTLQFEGFEQDAHVWLDEFLSEVFLPCGVIGTAGEDDAKKNGSWARNNLYAGTAAAWAAVEDAILTSTSLLNIRLSHAENRNRLRTAIGGAALTVEVVKAFDSKVRKALFGDTRDLPSQKHRSTSVLEKLTKPTRGTQIRTFGDAVTWLQAYADEHDGLVPSASGLKDAGISVEAIETVLPGVTSYKDWVHDNGALFGWTTSASATHQGGIAVLRAAFPDGDLRQEVDAPVVTKADGTPYSGRIDAVLSVDVDGTDVRFACEFEGEQHYRVVLRFGELAHLECRRNDVLRVASLALFEGPTVLVSLHHAVIRKERTRIGSDRLRTIMADAYHLGYRWIHIGQTGNPELRACPELPEIIESLSDDVITVHGALRSESTAMVA